MIKFVFYRNNTIGKLHMSDWRNQLTDANSPKEKCQILQTMLSQMTADSVDEYSTLQSATKGVYGPEIKAYGQKCLQFADKKFPKYSWR